MDLPESTIAHLRDEAYATVCRHALLAALEKLDRAKVTLASTRPPFGILASKETRATFARSMDAATGTEALLRTRLGQVTQLENTLQHLLGPKLRTYLRDVDPDFCHFAAVERLLNRWEVCYRELPDLLLAFARDVRGAQSADTSGQRDLQLFAVLRDSALTVERQLDLLDQFVTDLTALLPAEAAAEIRLPALPNFRRVTWVNHLATLPLAQLIAEATRVESEARAFVAAGHDTIAARLSVAHAVCQRHEGLYLHHYWNQLRAHAQTHYIEERDIDEVIDCLMETYVTSAVITRQRELSTNSPFLDER